MPVFFEMIYQGDTTHTPIKVQLLALCRTQPIWSGYKSAMDKRPHLLAGLANTDWLWEAVSIQTKATPP